MTDNNSNAIIEDSELKQCYEEIRNKTQYVLTHSQYDEFHRLAGLYESLHKLLEPFDTDDNVSHIIALLDHLNSTFFLELENLSVSARNV